MLPEPSQCYFVDLGIAVSFLALPQCSSERASSHWLNRFGTDASDVRRKRLVLCRGKICKGIEKSFICPLILNRNRGTYLLLLFGLDGSLFILPSQCTFGTRMQCPFLLAPIIGSLSELVHLKLPRRLRNMIGFTIRSLTKWLEFLFLPHA